MNHDPTLKAIKHDAAQQSYLWQLTGKGKRYVIDPKLGVVSRFGMHNGKIYACTASIEGLDNLSRAAKHDVMRFRVRSMLMNRDDLIEHA